MNKEDWALVSKGDKSAYARLYVFYYSKLYNYGRKFTQDLPLLEDTLQEALLSIWTSRARLPGLETPHTYLLNTFRYILFRKIRQAVKRRDLRDAGQAEPEFGVEQLLISRDLEASLRQRLESALRGLTGRQREAIYLRFYEGLSYEEVAVLMGISVKATYKMMARALLHLKENMSVTAWMLLLAKFFLTDVG
jgi:RNA polymerase sigma factor (sigma-70 family)